jgi:arylsulfatase A-like enzyme
MAEQEQTRHEHPPAGYGQPACCGGAIHTPDLHRFVAGGARFADTHTTAQ